MTTEIAEYPEHEKLSAIADKSQEIGAFLDWMEDQGIQRMVWRRDLTDWCTCPALHLTQTSIDRCARCDEEGRIEVHDVKGWVSERRNIQALLADYFGIDQDKIEQEKRAMLASLRA